MPLFECGCVCGYSNLVSVHQYTGFLLIKLLQQNITSFSISVVTQEQKRAKPWKIFQAAWGSRLKKGLTVLMKPWVSLLAQVTARAASTPPASHLLHLLALGTKCCCRGRSEKGPAALASQSPRGLSEKPPPAFQLSAFLTFL